MAHIWQLGCARCRPVETALRVWQGQAPRQEAAAPSEQETTAGAAEAAPSADAGAVAAPTAAKGVNRAVAALGSAYVDKCRPAHAAVAHSTLALAGLRASLARYLKQQGGAAQQQLGEVALAVAPTQDYRSCPAAAEGFRIVVATHSIVVITGELTGLMVWREHSLCLCDGTSAGNGNSAAHRLPPPKHWLGMTTCKRLHLSAGGGFITEPESTGIVVICKDCVQAWVGCPAGKLAKSTAILETHVQPVVWLLIMLGCYVLKADLAGCLHMVSHCVDDLGSARPAGN